MSFPSLGVKYLVAAGMLSACLQAAGPLQNGYMAGLFKRVDGDSRDRPLPPVQKLEQMAAPHGFVIRDLRNGEQFTFQVLAAPPGSGAPSSQAVQAQKDLAEAFPADGATLVVPVDLTGSGVSDLLYARKDWGGWRVFSNGGRLPAPFPGFLDGFYDKGSGTARRELIPADTHDLVVDDDLLAAVGDFLGNGTEQLAYTRPGWTQLWVVGAHGVVNMAADSQWLQMKCASSLTAPPKPPRKLATRSRRFRPRPGAWSAPWSRVCRRWKAAPARRPDRRGQRRHQLH